MQESISAVLYKHTVEAILSIYVEGPTDLVFFRKCLEKLKIDNICLFDVSIIDFEKFPFAENDLDYRQNRDKVIALGIRATTNDLKNLCGIIDADFAHISGECISVRNIFSTDTSCSEAYFWGKAKFIEFISDISRGKLSPHIPIIGKALNSMFAVRLVNRKYKIQILSDWVKYVDVEAGFKHEEYCKNMINRARMARQVKWQDFSLEVETVIKSILNEHVAINGHDMMEILIHYIDLVRNKKCFHDEDCLQTVIYQLECYNEIVSSPLFGKIARFSGVS